MEFCKGYPEYGYWNKSIGRGWGGVCDKLRETLVLISRNSDKPLIPTAREMVVVRLWTLI